VIALKALWIGTLLVLSLVPAGCEHPRILIDAGHGGYPLQEDRLSEFCRLASVKGFSVEIEDLETVNLQDYCLVLSANPDVQFSLQEAEHLTEYLVQGGTFFLTGAGDFENRDHSEVTNQLLEALGSHLRFNDDQLTDHINSGKSYIPLFDAWRPHPLTASLPPISLYSPESVVVNQGGYPLLCGNPTTKSEDTDGSVLTESRELIALLAVERIGKGDLLVGGSWGFVSGSTFTGHTEFAEQLLWYVQEKAPIPFYREIFHGASIVIGKAGRPEVDREGAEILAELLSGDVCLKSEKRITVIVGGPEVNPLCEEINAYLPIQMKKDETWYLLKDGQKIYGQEYGIIAVISVDNRRILVVAGLTGTGTMGAVKLLEQIDIHTLTMVYNTYGEAVLFKVSGDMNLNGIQEKSEHWEISLL